LFVKTKAIKLILRERETERSVEHIRGMSVELWAQKPRFP